jgi:hypothetical protein
MAAKHVIGVGFMVLALAGCTRATCECGAAPSSPLASVPTGPVAGFDVLITDKDQDVTVRVGQRIEVYLRQRAGLTAWNGLRSDDEAVLAPIPTGITAARGVTIGGFKAIMPGTASITAYATADCSPGQACPMFAVLFSVRVTVI